MNCDDIRLMYRCDDISFFAGIKKSWESDACLAPGIWWHPRFCRLKSVENWWTHCACVVIRLTRVGWCGAPRPCLVIDELRSRLVFAGGSPEELIDVSCWVPGVVPSVQVDTKLYSWLFGWCIFPLVQVYTKVNPWLFVWQVFPLLQVDARAV